MSSAKVSSFVVFGVPLVQFSDRHPNKSMSVCTVVVDIHNLLSNPIALPLWDPRNPGLVVDETDDDTVAFTMSAKSM